MTIRGKFRISFFLAFFLACCYSCVPALAQESRSGDDFFSYERFLSSARLIAKIGYDEKSNREINSFAKAYTDGINALADGDLEKAKGELSRALRYWPEYFGTDFLLALLYEESGDTNTAARHYKSYLNKLRDFQKGYYRISGPLIRVIGEGDTEEYNKAYFLVEEHLMRQGIDIAAVRPAAPFPVFLLYVVVLVFFIGLYFAVYFKLMPYLKRLSRVKNPPEGFWVCKYCGETSPVLSKVCNRCRRPRPE